MDGIYDALPKEARDGFRRALEEHLRSIGWYDELKTRCKAAVVDEPPEEVCVDDVVDKCMGFARDSVPVDARQDLTARIAEYLDENPDVLRRAVDQGGS